MLEKNKIVSNYKFQKLNFRILSIEKRLKIKFFAISFFVFWFADFIYRFQRCYWINQLIIYNKFLTIISKNKLIYSQNRNQRLMYCVKYRAKI